MTDHDSGANYPRIRLVRPQGSDVRTPEEIREGVVPPPSGERPTDEQVLQSLIANNCIPVRVSACLGITEEYVLAVAIRNTRALSTMMRARLMMSSFTTLIKMDAVMQVAMEDMPADALGRTYAATLTAFTNLAGQFEEKITDNDTDDAAAAKDSMLERLEKMGKREAAQQALYNDNESVGGTAS
jgi:hypothetical protein